VIDSLRGDSDDWINLVDLGAIPDPFDKLNECQFFLDLIGREADPQRFRWLISAFFGAAYSFFEISALCAYERFSNPDTGKPIANEEALEILRRYVVVVQDVKRPSFVKTAGLHPITKELYKLRKGNTHHSPLSIMKTSSDLPEGFHFGYLTGKGTPALAFCREAMALIIDVEHKLQQEL